jgi:DNA-binding NarL/FixJ family response regulator
VQPEASQESDQLRILVVDDHDIARKAVCVVLGSRESIEVCGEASDGEEAIEKALQMNPDCIIMDVYMPKMDGLSAANQIKKTLPTVPIIMLSAQDNLEIIQAAQGAGAQGFVTKSDAAAVLLSAVDAVLQGQTFFARRLGRD